MTETRFRIFEIVGIAVLAPAFFCLLHWIDGTRPFVTEFEAGGITGAVLIKFTEALRIHLQMNVK